MKLIFTSLLLLLTGLGWAQNFEIRVVNKGSGTLGIEMQETTGTGTPTTSDFFVDLVFGLRWDTAYGANLNAPSGSYAVARAGTEQRSGAYEYQAYNLSTSPHACPADWTQNTWVEVAQITSALGGIGNGTFEICPTGFNGTTDPYLDINITIQVAPTVNGSASNVLLGNTIVWDGDQNNNNWFTAGNWSSNSVPTQYSGVSIPASLSSYPILSNSVSIKNIAIASGATVSLNGQTMNIRGELSGSGGFIGSSTSNLNFTGSSSSSLTMSGTTMGTSNALNNLTIATSGTVTLSDTAEVFGLLTLTSGTLASGGNLILGATSSSSYAQIPPTGSGTLTGSITVEKAFANTNAGWRHISLPVNGTLDGIVNFDLLDTNHSVPSEKNVKYWNAVPVSGNDAPGWTVPDSTFGNTRGYAFYGNNSNGGKHDFSTVISASGTHVTGTHNFSVNYSIANGSANPDDRGWNLIGNPYASNLDVTTFWNTLLNSAGPYKAIHVYDQPNSQYMAICSTGVTIITTGGASSTPSSATVIPPFQAFWIKTNADLTISLSNANRTTSATGLGTFMKKNYDLARLDVYNADSAWDQTVLYFDENANGGLDNDLDAFKMYSENPDVPSLYSVTPDGNFAINAINSNSSAHSVPLGFYSLKQGTMSFNLNTNELDPKWFVYLEDKELGIFYDIKANPYSFNHTQNSNARFVLHFQTYGLGAEKLVSDVQNMKIGGDGNEVYVFIPAFYKEQNYQMEVIDMAGRVVYTDNKLSLNHGMNTLNLDLNANAYHVVRIKAAEGIETGKVQIR